MDPHPVPPVDPWEMWNKLRSLCAGSAKLAVDK